jgi:hypothetical protein
MSRLGLIGFFVAFVGCAHNAPNAFTAAPRRLAPVQLYLFNRSGKTVDLKVALDDSVLYYAQVRASAPSEIAGGRLVHRSRGTYRVTLNDFTHAQQMTRDVPVAESGVYIVVTTREDGSRINVSTTRPF